MAALAKSVRKNWMLLLMVLPGVVWCAIFRYGPMYGALIAFQKYHVGDSILGGRWAGLYWFKKFFSHPQFKQLLTNTLSISILQLIFCFPVPVIFALLLNEVRNAKLKKLVQTVSYLPHFISLVAVCSMLSLLLNPGSGIVNRVLNAMGIESIYFMGSTKWYRPIYILSQIWQTFGYSAIIYMSSLAAVPQELYESASVDGASRFRQMITISLPSIMPTVIIMLILESGKLLAVGYEKTLLLQNSANNSVADIISTFSYRVGLSQGMYSFGTAVDLFTGVVNCLMIFVVNKLSKRVSETSLW
jgi:putative aldouronate transport system permease protein